jgi:lipid A ethanolaminephosphotransferase
MSAVVHDALPGRRIGTGWTRPELGSETVALLVAAYLALACNGAFWSAVEASGSLGAGAGAAVTVASLFVMLTAANWLLLCLLSGGRTTKPVLTVLLIVSAMAAYYMRAYTVYLDPDMVRTILHTDGKESRELIAPGMVASVLTFGVLPALALWRVRIRRRPPGRALLIRGAVLIAAPALLAAAALVSFQDVAALLRNHREIRHLATPGNYLVSLARVLAEDGTAKNRSREPVGTDAHVVAAAQRPPRLLVIVVGETARAQNWGLDGYARQTTPELARIAPINYGEVTSCGSSTEVSLPCMFSPYGRRDYDKDRIRRSESLLHVLDHAGIATLWRDNQTGCKGVCDGLPFESYEHADDPAFCDAEGCRDEVLLQGLERRLDRPGDQVVVLHPIGNHGPSYYRRYPAGFERYTPACRDAELGHCSREEIVNAYDNALLYTDHVLARTIGLLAARPDRQSALIYVSDHGESLGENGLYLHGVPYAIAPRTQTHVPMIAWLSPAWLAQDGLDAACLRERARQPASHDNLFHSVLGLLDVATSVYDARLDLFTGCRRPALANAGAG